LQRLTDNLHRFQDRIVYGSYVGMRSPALLELWFTIWGLTDGARVREVLKPIVRYARTNRLADLCTYDVRPEDVLTGFGQSTEIDTAEAVLDRIDEFCDIMQELEDGKASVSETEVRLRAAMESDDRFDMHIEAITKGLGRHPWIFEPLKRHGVKAYSSAFLTPDEVLTLGVEPDAQAEIRVHPKPIPWKQERKAFEAQAEALLQELAAHRAQATVLFQERDALLRDRDAWRERATSAEEQVARGPSDRAK